MPGVKGRSGGKNKKTRIMHVVDGTGRKDRHGDLSKVTEPETPRGAVAPPAWLPPAARKIWDQVAPEMERLNLLASTDVPAFAALCVTYAELQWSCKQRQRWVKGSSKGTLHPVNKYRLQVIEKLKMLCDQFGATPASRARVADLLPMTPAAGGPAPAPTGTDGQTKITTRLGRPC